MGLRGARASRLRAGSAARFRRPSARRSPPGLPLASRARVQVHGKPPVFVVPEAKKRIDDRMHPELERRMLAARLAGQTKNYVRKNMHQATQ